MATQPVALMPEIRSARSDDLPAIERLLLDRRLQLDGVRELSVTSSSRTPAML